MKVLGTEVLERAAKIHGNLRAPVATWLAAAKAAGWKNLADLRRTWRSTDTVKGKTVFNIKGNNYRLIASVNYGSQTIIVKELLTHAEYSKGGWDQ